MAFLPAIFGRIGGWMLTAAGIIAGLALYRQSIRNDERDAIETETKLADATAIQERSKVDNTAAAAGRAGNVNWLRTHARRKK